MEREGVDGTGLGHRRGDGLCSGDSDGSVQTENVH